VVVILRIGLGAFLFEKGSGPLKVLSPIFTEEINPQPYTNKRETNDTADHSAQRTIPIKPRIKI